MGLLNRFFSSTESVARNIQETEESIIKHWQHYLTTIPKKKKIINKLDLNDNLQKLKELLELELIDISNEEKKESELISDLETLEHSQKIKRVHRLEQCLGYVETKYEYVHGLLHQLYSTLKSQIHLVTKLQIASKDTEKLISHLKSQFELELEIIKKIEKTEKFHDLFLALVKGEHIIQTMDSKEKQLVKKMQEGFSKIFSNEIKEGITYEWAITVKNALDDEIHEGMLNGMLKSYDYIDFEFTNRPEFVDLVRKTIQNLKKGKVSEKMINAFVYLFREWYNHERD